MPEDQFKNDTPPARGAIDTAKKTSRTYAQRLWSILRLYGQTEKIDPPRESRSENKIPERQSFNSPGLLKILSVFPYLLILLFSISFFWDFNNIQWNFLGFTFQAEGLLKIVSISGLIGFLTNWLAITMLFKPVEKRPIFGQGLIPAQKDRIAYRLAQAVSQDLINPKLIKDRIHRSQLISKYRSQSTEYLRNIIDNPGFRNDIKKWTLHYMRDLMADPEIRTAMAEKIIIEIDQILQDKSFERLALRAYSFIKGDEMQRIVEESLVKLPGSIESGLDKIDDLLDQLPKTIDRNSDDIEELVTKLLYKLINRLDVHALVEENLRNYDEQKLSQIIRGATNEQLRYIQYLGAVLGMMGGFVIWQPLLSLSVFALLIGFLLLADQLLYSYSYR